jgi:hypothetical protein
VNTKTGPLTKGHILYPWEFQHNVGKPDYNYKNIVDEESQHLFNFNFGVLVCGIRV